MVETLIFVLKVLFFISLLSPALMFVPVDNGHREVGYLLYLLPNEKNWRTSYVLFLCPMLLRPLDPYFSWWVMAGFISVFPWFTTVSYLGWDICWSLNNLGRQKDSSLVCGAMTRAASTHTHNWYKQRTGLRKKCCFQSRHWLIFSRAL